MYKVIHRCVIGSFENTTLRCPLWYDDRNEDATLEHIGPTCKEGHYVAFLRSLARGSFDWYSLPPLVGLKT